MVDFYIDASKGQTIAQAQMVPGNRIFLQRGQIHPISFYRFFVDDMVLDAYGDEKLPLPILDKQADGDAWLYIKAGKNITLRNFSFRGNGKTGALIALSTTGGGKISGARIENVHMSDSGGHGFIAQGKDGGSVRDVRVVKCTAHRTFNHGMIAVADCQDVAFIDCEAGHNGLGIGAHGFSAYAISKSPRPFNVSFVRCFAHDAVDYDGLEGQGFQADDNSEGIRFINCHSSNNGGAGFAFNKSNNHFMHGCVADNNKKIGLVINGTGSVVACNTFMGNGANGKYFEEVQVFDPGNVLCSNTLHNRRNLKNGIRFYAPPLHQSNNVTFGYQTPIEGA